ncbi:MAG: XRE family transcriptional regulator [Spirochaetia bacterium]
MIGKRLKRARAAAGLSLQALGDMVGVSANMIKKYEHDQSMPSSEKLIKLAKALNVRSEYFFRPIHNELSKIEYRKKSKVPKKALNKIKADVIDQAERWLELKNLWPNFPVPQFSNLPALPEKIKSMDQIEKAANLVRRSWQLGLNPLPDVIDIIESHGILVIVTKAGTGDDFDGLQAVLDSQPIIVISEHWKGDRQRFTLAHELGHLLLAGRLDASVDEEKACHRFAGAYLIPAQSMRQQLGEKRHNIEPRELYLLKQDYGLSMQACLYRAADIGIISDTTKNKIFIEFSKRRWRKAEPGEPYPKEQTSLYQQLVYRALGEGIIGESKAAELLQLSLIEFHRERKLERVDAATRQWCKHPHRF